jgi:hypothetical protein
VMAHPSVFFDKTSVGSNGGHRCQDSNGVYTNPADFIAAGADQYTILIAFHPTIHGTTGAKTMLTTTWWSYSAMTNYVSPGVFAGMGYGYSGGYIQRNTPDTYGLGTSHVLRVRKDATTMYVSLDGGAENTIAHGNVGDLTYGGSGLYGLWLGYNGYAGSGNSAFSGRIGEVAIWNVCLAGADAADATSYFTDKWLDLPAPPIIGSGVIGVNTTVSASHAVAVGVDGNVNTHSDSGVLKVFGKMHVTGTVTADGAITDGLDVSAEFDALGV